MKVARVALLFVWAVAVLLAVYSRGLADGQLHEQRERLTERGCEQIAREPELWECEVGERIEGKP